MGSNTTSENPNKFRILMIHGFAATGQKFGAKARPISDRINELLAPEIRDEFPGGIEFLYPDAPIVLECPIGLEETRDEDLDEKEKHNYSTMEEPKDLSNRAWWYGRDTIHAYKGLERSLSSVATFIRGQPIHGVIGFSQGAALSGMITSLLDCCDNPEKVAAIRKQGLPVDDFLSLPGQEPLRFFIGCGGYQGTLKYYGSLYEWPIRTPSCHTIADIDGIVEDYRTINLARCFSTAEMVHYFGSHFVPRDRTTVQTLAHFAAKHSTSGRPLSRGSSPVVDVENRATKRNASKDGNESGNTNSQKSLRSSKRRKIFTLRSRRKQVVSTRQIIPAFNHTCFVV
ncbi:Family of serine hydrolases 3 [Paecilomyces lecythidis]|uniref:Family of serine hydrolases 3 n=1 Tax=Paecilomyces lecythidis TaxID=3004212 RepID=A0ABR3XFA6_9EURO